MPPTAATAPARPAPVPSRRRPNSAPRPIAHRTIADLLKSLGGIPASRVLLAPTPGTATKRDVIAIHRREGRLCELVDGTLVEKTMGFEESGVAFALIYFLGDFLRRHNLGIATGPDGTLLLTTGLLRIPDVAFISWDRLPDRKRPTQPIPKVNLDLAVEVLSKSNTKAEMNRKLLEYLDAGVLLVWLIDPRDRTIRVYRSATDVVTLTEADVLDGGDVLPGFRLPVAELFAQATRGPDA